MRRAVVVVSTGSTGPDARTEARGWLEVIRLAERQRRRDAGEPVMELST